MDANECRTKKYNLWFLKKNAFCRQGLFINYEKMYVLFNNNKKKNTQTNKNVYVFKS